MYTLEGAEKEIWKRWENISLRRNVEEFLGNDIPEVMKVSPLAVLARQLATPNFESQRFHDQVKMSGLKHLWWTYHEDQFCSANPDKIAWAKMGFMKGRDKNNHPIVVKRSIINFQLSEMKPFTHIRTVWGEPFVSFHQRIFHAALPGCETWDASAWLKTKGENSKNYYIFYLSLFIANGILFENFLKFGKEEKITREIVEPTLAELKKLFGVKPLIVPLLPLKEEHEPYWTWYPHSLEKEAKSASKIPTSDTARP